MRLPRTFLALLAFAAPSFAGQSLVLGGPPGVAIGDPQVSPKQSWRVEFQLHNFTLPGAGVYTAVIYDLLGTGSIARLSPDGRLSVETLDRVTENQPCMVPIGGRTNVLVRIQKDVAAMQFSCEIWNYDGTGYQNHVMSISSLEPRPYSGGSIGGGAQAAMGFFRIATTLMPLGARPPTTADGGDWTELKFDGNLKDSGHHGHGGSGDARFMPTPNQVAFASPRTAGAPAWSSWTSLRAGYPAQLDGSASYSLADASSTVSGVWRQTKGPSALKWTAQTTLHPTIEGLIFGTYEFVLKVVDAAGNTASAALEAGAVATDDNGVVVNADPNVDRIFGPMIAFGKNPWGYADERAMSATRLRMAAYEAQGLNPPSWAKPGAGTVTYLFNGAGPGGGRAARLAKAVSASDMAIAVTDASPLDLADLPARILLGDGSREEVRICAASATTGPATLTVCYDGRGQGSPADGYRAAAQAWPVGTMAGQMKVKGSGTRFLSDICAAGPGPNGNPLYTTGSVRLTAGQAAVAGVGSAWNAGNGARAGNILRVSATHGGTPFVFTAYIASVADPAHLTLSRPYPKDADPGSFPYSIILADTREMTLHYTRPGNKSDAQTYFQTSGCESDTDAYLYSGHHIDGLDGTLQKARKYSYMEGFGYTTAFGANFYGEDLAHRALYYRSGWDPALKAARVFGDNYVDSPQIAGGDVSAMTLLIGGGVVGGFTAAILDTSDPKRPSWDTLRGLARQGAIGELGCNETDTRDSGYAGLWLTLAAGYDPDPAQRANWQSALAQIFARDEKCKGADNSWANGFLWNGNSVPLSLTKGSPVVTGADIPAGICFGVSSGAIDVTKGSATATGTGFVAGRQIVIDGTRNGAPYAAFLEFALKPDGSIALGALWPGDSGRATFVVENNDFHSVIATGNNDPQMTRNWACTWNSATKITLDRPWDGPTETGAHMYSYTLAGYGQQPFMLGIKITQMKLASQIAPASYAQKYGALAAAAATWIHDVGFDPVTQGLFYGRIFQTCEPATVPPPNSNFGTRTPGCNNGVDPSGIRTARVLTAEASQALRVYYEAHPTPEAKAWGDLAYGSIWGNPPLTTGGVYQDANYVRDENSNSGLGAYKWTGFFFGMGMAHQWPAVRLGGVAPPRNRNVSLAIKPGAETTAKTRVWVTAPSGAVKAWPCASLSSCDVTVDDRQGSHWYVVQYLSADGAVLSQSDPALIAGSGDGAKAPGSKQ